MKVEPRPGENGLYIDIEPENDLEQEFIERAIDAALRIIDTALKYKCRTSVSPTYSTVRKPHVYITIGFEKKGT